jgi:hypothetical protein
VTNSSSSSYVVLYEITRCPELDAFIKEEYGKYGLGLLDKYVKRGREMDRREFEYLDDALYLGDKPESAYSPDKDYLKAVFYTYCTEGDEEGDDVFLATIIPDQYKKEVWSER